MALLLSLSIFVSNIFFSFDNQNLIFNTGSEFIFYSKNYFNIYSYDGTLKNSFFVSDEIAGPDGPLAEYGLVSDPELEKTQAMVDGL